MELGEALVDRLPLRPACPFKVGFLGRWVGNEDLALVGILSSFPMRRQVWLCLILEVVWGWSYLERIWSTAGPWALVEPWDGVETFLGGHAHWSIIILL